MYADTLAYDADAEAFAQFQVPPPVFRNAASASSSVERGQQPQQVQEQYGQSTGYAHQSYLAEPATQAYEDYHEQWPWGKPVEQEAHVAPTLEYTMPHAVECPAEKPASRAASIAPPSLPSPPPRQLEEEPAVPKTQVDRNLAPPEWQPQNLGMPAPLPEPVAEAASAVAPTLQYETLQMGGEEAEQGEAASEAQTAATVVVPSPPPPPPRRRRKSEAPTPPPARSAAAAEAKAPDTRRRPRNAPPTFSVAAAPAQEVAESATAAPPAPASKRRRLWRKQPPPPEYLQAPVAGPRTTDAAAAAEASASSSLKSSLRRSAPRATEPAAPSTSVAPPRQRDGAASGGGASSSTEPRSRSPPLGSHRLGVIGRQAVVRGDGWGAGKGTYVATVKQADDSTYTVLVSIGAKKWEEKVVLQEHCALLPPSSMPAKLLKK